jgi:hypothetical protein
LKKKNSFQNNFFLFQCVLKSGIVFYVKQILHMLMSAHLKKSDKCTYQLL